MTTLCFANCKGGTAKSTSVVAMAQAMAHLGKSVLVIDLDPQGNASFFLGADTNKRGSYELITGERHAQFVTQHINGIDVIPAGHSLLTLTPSNGSARRLQNAIAPLKKKYDYILIDTPPTTGELQYNGIQASDSIFISLLADVPSMQGLYLINDIANKFKASNKWLSIAGAVICNYDGRSGLVKNVEAMIKDKMKLLNIPFMGTVRRAVAIQEAQAFQQSLYDYAPNSKPAQDYLEIAKMIIAKEGN